ncbi:hypothetical protein LshimejAT787_1700030 [Lyophyllum shimeji]|uniref:Protein kinase domain-containing protein n=1 Tax=Lyophyllum shimeji TaxID=47721 RepID=A0A9P3PZA3_LYOSH|nr:hypothetical protein LshimejAT787_1700030 [Lyophyllum shimeji]
MTYPPLLLRPVDLAVWLVLGWKPTPSLRRMLRMKGAQVQDSCRVSTIEGARDEPSILTILLARCPSVPPRPAGRDVAQGYQSRYTVQGNGCAKGFKSTRAEQPQSATEITQRHYPKLSFARLPLTYLDIGTEAMPPEEPHMNVQRLFVRKIGDALVADRRRLTIEIAPTKDLYALRMAIYKEAREVKLLREEETIELWRPNEDITKGTAGADRITGRLKDSTLDVIATAVDDEQTIDSIERNVPTCQGNYIHLLVEVIPRFDNPPAQLFAPPADTTAFITLKFQALLIATRHTASPSASAQSDKYLKHQGSTFPILDGRWDPSAGSPATQAPPIELFHPVFAEFRAKFSDITTPTPDEVIRKTASLVRSVSAIAPTEQTTALVLVEEKDELGIDGSEPSVQGSFSYAKFWADDYHRQDGRLHPRFFPSISSYPSNNTTVKFTYKEPLDRVDTCVTFLATLDSANGRPIVVKFVQRYGEAVHKLLAGLGMAPGLLYCGPIGGHGVSYGELQMVVMESVQGKTLADYFDSGPLPRDVVAAVEEGIKAIHAAGFVYADLRRPNIMIADAVDRDIETSLGERVKFIDFDWAGKAGDIRYPLHLSDSIRTPTGASEYELIQKTHDTKMLEAL